MVISHRLELEDAPSQRLAYSLTQTLFRISTTVPALQERVQSAFLSHLEKIGTVCANSIADQDINTLLSSILSLIGSTEAAIAHLPTGSPNLVARLLTTIQPLIDQQI